MSDHVSQPIVITHPVTIFQKGGMFGCVGFWSNGHRHFVGSFDGRCNPPVYELGFDDLDTARLAYSKYVTQTVEERGWKIAWRGRPNVG